MDLITTISPARRCASDNAVRETNPKRFLVGTGSSIFPLPPTLENPIAPLTAIGKIAGGAEFARDRGFVKLVTFYSVLPWWIFARAS